MKPSRPDKPAAATLKAATDSGLPAAPLRPLVYQPIVAVSLVLIAATLTQIAVHVVHLRLLAPGGAGPAAINPSSWVANGWAYAAIDRWLEQAGMLTGAGPRLPFAVLLIIGLLSSVGWYAVGRNLLGPGWGLWGGLAWAFHPLFGFLVQRPSPLTFGLFALPAAWAALLWWNRCRRRRVALLAGLLAGMAALVSIAWGAAFVAMAPLLFVAGGVNRRSLQSFPLLWLGFAIPLLAVWVAVAAWAAPNPLDLLSTDIIRALEDSESPFARAVHSRFANGPRPGIRAPLAVAAHGAMNSPADAARWFAGRAWQTLYATNGGYFQRPLFVAQMVVLIPALWGILVCLREPLWRWPTLAGLVLIVANWAVAALAEALARSIAPVSGLLVLFAIVGIADVYERLFGRRLVVSG